jgi:hypothetical protein
VKWSLAFSPGLAVVHTDKAPIFTAGKKDRGKGWFEGLKMARPIRRLPSNAAYHQAGAVNCSDCPKSNDAIS